MRQRIGAGTLAAVSVCAIAIGHGDKGGGAPPPSGLTGFTSENVLLRGRISLQEFGATRGNDCWGYVSPSGREYALMGMRERTAVVEITDPAAPTVVATFEHAHSGWSDIKVYGSHAYVVTDGEGVGLQVIDLSEVDSGRATVAATITASGFAFAHNIAVNEESGRLYTLGSNVFAEGVVAWSLADPVNPTIIGAYDGSGYTHDAQVVTMRSGPWAGREIAFLFAEERGIDIVDVTDPSDMRRLSMTTYEGVGYVHQGWFDHATNLLYQNDELDELIYGVPTTTRVWDMSDLTAPTLAGAFTTGLPAIDHNNYTHEGFVYQANYRSGLRIFDARTDPVNPTEVGWFDTVAASDSIGFGGAWSVYPYFPSGNAIISDIEGGLFVVDPTWARLGGPPLMFEFPDGLPASVPTTGATVRVRITGERGAEVVPGTPALHVLGGGVRTSHSLTALADGLFEAHLPPMACGQDMAYWFGADATVGGSVQTPLDAPEGAFVAVVGAAPITAFADTFDLSRGWTIGGPDDSASSGVWVRAQPVESPGQPGQDSDDAGAICFVTGNGAPGGSAGGDSVSGGATTLTSPLLNGAPATAARVRCQLWWSSDQGKNPDEDALRIEVSADGGATWTLLEEIRQSTNAWVERVWRLDGVVPLTDAMRVRFVAQDLGGLSVTEAAVDNFRFELQSCARTPDLNLDGRVNSTDLGIMLSDWGRAGVPADLNLDGTVDGSDLGTMLGRWG